MNVINLRNHGLIKFALIVLFHDCYVLSNRLKAFIGAILS